MAGPIGFSSLGIKGLEKVDSSKIFVMFNFYFLGLVNIAKQNHYPSLSGSMDAGVGEEV